MRRRKDGRGWIWSMVLSSCN